MVSTAIGTTARIENRWKYSARNQTQICARTAG